MNKPVWFLDIDGVINGDAQKPRYFDEWKKVFVPATNKWGNTIDFPIHYAPALIDFINAMSEKVDIVWLTTWADQAITNFAPAVGITGTFPEGFGLAGIDVDSKQYSGWGGMMNAKSRSVTILGKGMFAGRPVIWTDDQAHKTLRKMVKSSLGEETPSLLISPAASTGINPWDMERITTFVADNT